MTETWKGPTHRSDLFGFVDIVAVGAGAIYFLQVTTTANQAARVSKILKTPDLAAAATEILVTGNRVEVWGWLRSADGGDYLTRTALRAIGRGRGRWQLTTEVIEDD